MKFSHSLALLILLLTTGAGMAQAPPAEIQIETSLT
jgi:hypothetical protein